jgi:hypothetical protein
MNEAASLILSEAAGSRSATSDQTAARGAAAALLARRDSKQSQPATTKARRPAKR